MAVVVDEEDGAAAGRLRHGVGQQALLDDEHAGRLNAADELVDREEDGVFRQQTRMVGGDLKRGKESYKKVPVDDEDPRGQ